MNIKKINLLFLLTNATFISVRCMNMPKPLTCVPKNSRTQQKNSSLLRTTINKAPLPITCKNLATDPEKEIGRLSNHPSTLLNFLISLKK